MGEATLPVPLPSTKAEISIHASRGGSDLFCLYGHVARWQFQSTLPVGEATEQGGSCARGEPFQSTLPVGEATFAPTLEVVRQAISIHASRGGSDILQA